MNIIIFLLGFFLFTRPAVAGNNLAITCDQQQCSHLSNLPLFSETNIYPGYLISQTLTVTNSRSDDCQLHFKATAHDSPPNNLPSQIMFSITNSPDVLYSNSLANLTSASYHFLSQIGTGQTQTQIWTASFNSSAGNSFQNLATNFDLNFNFSCGQEEPSVDSSDDDGQVLGASLLQFVMILRPLLLHPT